MCNHFGVLSVGPNTPIAQIVQFAQQLANRVRTGAAPEVGGEKIDVHQISNASTCLLDAKTRAPELLLVHPEVRHDREQLEDVVKKLQKVASLPACHDPLPLVHPLGVLWFVPPPGEEAAAWPELGEFALAEPGDPADAAFDVVFDS